MTKLLEKAFAAVRDLPPDAQDDVARLVLQLVEDNSAVQLTNDERQAVAVSKAAATRGEFATDAQVKAAWAREDRP